MDAGCLYVCCGPGCCCRYCCQQPCIVLLCGSVNFPFFPCPVFPTQYQHVGLSSRALLHQQNGCLGVGGEFCMYFVVMVVMMAAHLLTTHLHTHRHCCCNIVCKYIAIVVFVTVRRTNGRTAKRCLKVTISLLVMVVMDTVFERVSVFVLTVMWALEWAAFLLCIYGLGRWLLELLNFVPLFCCGRTLIARNTAMCVSVHQSGGFFFFPRDIRFVCCMHERV